MFILKILIAVGLTSWVLKHFDINKCCLHSQTENKHLILNVALKIKYSELTFKYKETP